MKHSYIFFDVKGTLLYKQNLYNTIQSCLEAAGFSVPIETLRNQHVIVSSVVSFPSKTTRAFYDTFNSALLYTLGIIPTKPLFDTLYTRCKKLPWRPYRDTAALDSIHTQMGILSNWDRTLERKLAELIPIAFERIVSSTQAGVAKPDKRFYRSAFAQLGVPVKHIVYIGDSVKLDIEPVLALGARAILIDRENRFPWYTGERIRSLHEIVRILRK